jgi:hypothetical protein
MDATSLRLMPVEEQCTMQFPSSNALRLRKLQMRISRVLHRLAADQCRNARSCSVAAILKLKIVRRSLFVICEFPVSLGQTTILDTQSLLGRNVSQHSVFFGKVVMPFSFSDVVYHCKLSLRAIR